MYFLCENSAKYASLSCSKVTRIPVDKYGLTKNKVAQPPPISQAIVNLYLYGKRGFNKKVDSLVDLVLNDYYIRSYTRKLMHVSYDENISFSFLGKRPFKMNILCYFHNSVYDLT